MASTNLLLRDLASKVKQVPSNYIRPISDRPNLSDVEVSDGSIPLIDLQDLCGPNRSDVLKQIALARQHDGFLQVKNHGISEAMINNMLGLAREFFHMPESERLKNYSDDPNTANRLSTSFNVKTEKVANWRDFLRLHCYPLEDNVHKWPSNPPSFRKDVWECVNQTNVIEFLIIKEELMQFVKREQVRQERPWSLDRRDNNALNKRFFMRTINNIIGATTEWATSEMAIGTPPTRAKQSDWCVSFTEQDAILKAEEGNDPIVVSAIIGNHCINRILIDNGSDVEILQWSVFQQMGFDAQDLTPTNPIFGFANQPIPVKGTIKLPVTIGDGEYVTTTMVNFLVVDQLSAYYAIFGRPIMKKTKMVTAVYCLTVKFPTANGIGHMHSNQTVARQCQLLSMEIAQKYQEQRSTSATPTNPATTNPATLNLIHPNHSQILTFDNFDTKDGLNFYSLQPVEKTESGLPLILFPNTVILNIRDQMQVISNDRYKRVLHRAVVNCDKERIAIPTFYCPSPDASIGPAAELVDDEHPAVYRSFTYGEFYEKFWKRGLATECCLDLFKTSVA